MTLGPESTVKLRNIGEVDFTAQYGGVNYSIPPDGEFFIPFAAACLWFGHPDAIDIDAQNRHRTEELTRLRIRYGLHEVTVEPPFLDDQRLFPNPDSGKSTWETRIPKVEIIDLDDTPISMVIHDPEGRNVTPASQSQAQQDLVQVELAAMRRRQQELERQLSEMTAANVAAADGGAVGSDGPVGPSGMPIAQPPANRQGSGPNIKLPAPTPSTPSADPQPVPGAEVTTDGPTRVRVSG